MIRARQRRRDRRWTVAVLSALILHAMTLPPQIHAQNEVVISLDSVRQVIKGFGAANIVPWRPDMTADNIQKAFGTGPGQIGFTILRLRVPYQDSEFGLNVPTAQAAYSMGVTIIASPWTAPATMKTSNNIVGGSLYDTSYASYAAHLKSFVDYMASNGVPLYAVSVQNEPDVHVTYESMDWNAAQMVKFVKEQGQNVGTKVLAPEESNFNPTIANAILNDSAAAANTAIIGGHIYGGGLGPYPLAASKGKELWMTEHLDTDTSWTAVFATGKEINDVMNSDMNAYIWWYLVRFYGPIHESGYVTKRGYVVSQFARFVRPNYVRVLSTIPRGSVYVTAYKAPPGISKFVIVALNLGSTSVTQTFSVQNLAGGAATVRPYITSKTKNCEQQSDINVSNGTFAATLDDSSITTFVADVVSSVADGSTVPQTFELSQNYPNPFNPATEIRYEIPVASTVTLKVYDLLGRDVVTLVDGQKAAGSYKVTFDASSFSSGVYFYSLHAGDHHAVRKMVLMK